VLAGGGRRVGEVCGAQAEVLAVTDGPEEDGSRLSTASSSRTERWLRAVSTPAMARSGKRRGMAAVAGSRVPTMAAPAARAPDGAVPGRLLRRGGGEGELGASLSGFSCRAQNRGNG
jgi:hypothetical protein